VLPVLSVEVRVGARSHKTDKVSRSTSPEFGESGWYDFFIFNNKQKISLELVSTAYLFNSSDVIGRMYDVTIGNVISNQNEVQELDLYSEKTRIESDDPQKAGIVLLNAEHYRFVQDRTYLTKPPSVHGDANNIALLTVNVFGMRGLPPEYSSGATLILHIEDQVFETHGSTFMDAEKIDITDVEGQVISAPEQRMAEYLYKEKGMSLEDIAEISGLDSESLERVIKNRPSYTAVWNHGFNILVKNLDSEINVRLKVRNQAQSIQIEKPFRIQQVLDKPDLKWEGVLSLNTSKAKKHMKKPDHKAEDSKVSDFLGSLDVLIKFSLWGLVKGAD